MAALVVEAMEEAGVSRICSCLCCPSTCLAQPACCTQVAMTRAGATSKPHHPRLRMGRPLQLPQGAMGAGVVVDHPSPRRCAKATGPAPSARTPTTPSGVQGCQADASGPLQAKAYLPRLLQRVSLHKAPRFTNSCYCRSQCHRCNTPKPGGGGGGGGGGGRGGGRFGDGGGRGRGRTQAAPQGPPGTSSSQHLHVLGAEGLRLKPALAAVVSSWTHWLLLVPLACALINLTACAYSSCFAGCRHVRGRRLDLPWLRQRELGAPQHLQHVQYGQARHCGHQPGRLWRRLQGTAWPTHAVSEALAAVAEQLDKLLFLYSCLQHSSSHCHSESHHHMGRLATRPCSASRLALSGHPATGGASSSTGFPSPPSHDLTQHACRSWTKLSWRLLASGGSRMRRLSSAPLGAGALNAAAAAPRMQCLVACRYDEYGRLKRQHRDGGEDRRAREAAALARLQSVRLIGRAELCSRVAAHMSLLCRELGEGAAAVAARTTGSSGPSFSVTWDSLSLAMPSACYLPSQVVCAASQRTTCAHVAQLQLSRGSCVKATVGVCKLNTAALNIDED